MSISSVGSASNIEQISQMLASTLQTIQTTDTSTVPQDSTQISGPGQLMSQLQQLQSSNPAEFKQVTAQIAQTLQQDASTQTGSAATALQQIASQFQQASQTGQMPLPADGASGHHHGHGSYAAQAGGSSDDVMSIVQSTLQTALQGAATASDS